MFLFPPFQFFLGFEALSERSSPWTGKNPQENPIPGFPSLGFEPGGLINYPGRLITLAGELSHLLSPLALGALGICSGCGALARPCRIGMSTRLGCRIEELMDNGKSHGTAQPCPLESGNTEFWLDKVMDNGKFQPCLVLQDQGTQGFHVPAFPAGDARGKQMGWDRI